MVRSGDKKHRNTSKQSAKEKKGRNENDDGSAIRVKNEKTGLFPWNSDRTQPELSHSSCVRSEFQGNRPVFSFLTLIAEPSSFSFLPFFSFADCLLVFLCFLSPERTMGESQRASERIILFVCGCLNQSFAQIENIFVKTALFF